MTRVERGRAGQKIACLAANQRIRLPVLFCDGLNIPVHDGGVRTESDRTDEGGG
jgi:hypothetical protein